MDYLIDIIMFVKTINKFIKKMIMGDKISEL